MDDRVVLTDWIRDLANFKGGWPGAVVMLATVVCTGLGAYYGINLFPDGEYSRIVLALPGLAAGATVFFVLAFASWAAFGRTTGSATRTKKPIARILILLLFGLPLLALGLWIVRFLIQSHGGDGDWFKEWLMCIVTLGLGGRFCMAAIAAFRDGEQQGEG